VAQSRRNWSRQFWLGAAESLREQPALNWVPRAPEIAEVSEPFDRMRVALVWQGMERKMNILSKLLLWRPVL